MMRHESTHRRLFARQTKFIQRIYADANDCLIPVTVSTAAERGGQQSLRSRHSWWPQAYWIRSRPEVLTPTDPYTRQCKQPALRDLVTPNAAHWNDGPPGGQIERGSSTCCIRLRSPVSVPAWREVVS
jgi:hypothetical protein